ncbi:ABC transporter substrate-binding protein [Saccharopolyspora shandongensis]|uniref:ABC transporter substrate-binding protein n=1 Tax=Saccharopolyspora shandongensis TaxID=418495 RepID=UPI003411B4AE
MTVLRGMAWGHQRGVGCLREVSAAYARRHPGVRISWDSRSLREFEDVPVVELAARYDLIAMDHPYVGQAHASSALVPLEELLPESFLAQQRANSTGPSFASYTWAGSQWAVSMDAAAQVSAYRPEALDAAPASWADVTACLKEMPRHRALLPANPTHLICGLLTLCSQIGGSGWLDRAGLDPEVAVPAAEWLLGLLALVDARSLDLDPIEALTAMSTGDVAYSPMVFGYVNYARDHAVRFADIPSPDGTPAGSLLGGVGLAISAKCAEPVAAARFLSHVVSPECQRGEYAAAGGQPGNRAAWTDPAVDAASGGFYSATLGTLDRAFVRPRHIAYPVVHRRAADEIHPLVRRGTTAGEIVRRFNEVCAATYAELEP